MDKRIIDARGRSCPEPVLMTMEVIKNKETEFEVIVDNKVAVENITRCCRSKGYALEVAEQAEDFKLLITRK